MDKCSTVEAADSAGSAGSTPICNEGHLRVKKIKMA